MNCHSSVRQEHCTPCKTIVQSCMMALAFPLISVIIPAYNRERHLSQCLESVLAQTWTRLEAIVVDDGSTDGTRELVACFQSRDERIRYISKPNGGVSSARNVGIQAAHGDWIAFLDSDDAWLPWKLEAQAAGLNALPDVGMIWTDMAAINEQGTQLFERYLRRMYGSYQKQSEPLFGRFVDLDLPSLKPFSRDRLRIGHGEIYPQMLRGNLVHTSTVLIRKDRALQTGLFDESYRRAGEDFGFHLRTCRLGPVALLDEPSILYRIGADDQLTHRRFQVSLAEAFLRTITEEVQSQKGNVPLTRKQLHAVFSEAHCWLGTELLSQGHWRSALPHLLESLQYEQTNLAAWRQLGRMVLPNPVRKAIKRVLLGKTNPFPATGRELPVTPCPKKFLTVGLGKQGSLESS